MVLSRLYERAIIIYNEANGAVHEQVFQASEDQASSQQYSPVSLSPPPPLINELGAYLSPKAMVSRPCNFGLVSVITFWGLCVQEI